MHRETKSVINRITRSSSVDIPLAAGCSPVTRTTVVAALARGFEARAFAGAAVVLALAALVRAAVGFAAGFFVFAVVGMDQS